MNGLDYSKFIAQRDDGSGMDRALYMAMSLANARQAMEQRTQEMELVKQRIAEQEQKQFETKRFQRAFQDFVQIGNYSAEAVAKFTADNPMYAKGIGEFKSTMDELSQLPVKNMLKDTLHGLLLVDPTDKEAAKKEDGIYSVITQNLEPFKNSENPKVAQFAKMLEPVIKIDQANVANGHPRVMLPNFAAVTMSYVKEKEYADVYDKAMELRRKEQLQPFEQRTAKAEARIKEAEATTAEVGAKYAEKLTKATLAKQWGDAALSREQKRIALLDLELRRAESGLRGKELELRMSELRRKRDFAIKDRNNLIATRVAALDDVVTLAVGVQKHPGLPGVFGGGWRIAQQYQPLWASEAKDANALVDQLVDTLTLGNLEKMKGFGRLSDTDVKILARSGTTLSDRSISDQLAWTEIQKIIDRVNDAKQRYLQNMAPELLKQPKAQPRLRKGLTLTPNERNQLQQLIGR